MTRWAMVFSSVLALVLAGCSDQAPVGLPIAPAKTGASAVRYDPEPLEQKFPKLPRPVVGEWVQGFFGDAPLPGPDATYWLDTIIELPPQQLDAFVEPFRSSMTVVVRPELWKTLQRDLPHPPFKHSDELDKFLSTAGPQGGWKVKAYVPEEASVLVLTAEGRDIT